ncbi:PREDICTED: ubiquitin-associated domain-containing protein 1 [Rhinopithecus bieti]|nr:PREDICTED: ubiquitin-associated domain-containing protein 1 [Rhinopithecus bieti]
MLSQSDSQALPEKAEHWEKAAVDLLQPQDGDMGMTGQLPAALKLAQQLGWPLTQLPMVPSTRCPKSTCLASSSLPAPLCFSATARHRGALEPGDGNCWQGAPAGPGLQTVCVWEWAGPETPLPLLKVPERRRASARLELEAYRGLVLADRQEMESRWRQQFSPEPKGLMPGEAESEVDTREAQHLDLPPGPHLGLLGSERRGPGEAPVTNYCKFHECHFSPEHAAFRKVGPLRLCDMIPGDAGKVLRLHICASDGAEWLEEGTEDTSVEKLKERCLKHCAHGSLEDPKSITHHKLIHAASERVLSDARTILEENIQDQDVLLLITKRAPSPLPKMAEVSAEEKKKQDQKAPDKEAILRATANLPSYNMDRAAVQTNMRDFQTELRKILVSLIEVAQKLLALNPDAVELFKKANAMLDEDEDERVDEAALRQLTEMGFPENRATKALQLNHMSVPQAMEWLIEHAEDPTIDTPLPGQAPSGAEGAAAATPEAATGASTTEEEEARDELTEIFKKIRRKREFRADARAVISLMEMGFDEKEVIDALRVNNNQQNAACEWLLGDRKPSPEELDKGIDPDSPLFQAILDNPVVQLGLTNPKTLLAFEDMLENPLNSTQWMNDPETGPVMLQISRIFQTLNRT